MHTLTPLDYLPWSISHCDLISAADACTLTCHHSNSEMYWCIMTDWALRRHSRLLKLLLCYFFFFFLGWWAVIQAYTHSVFPGIVIGGLAVKATALSQPVRDLLREDKDRRKDECIVEVPFFNDKFWFLSPLSRSLQFSFQCRVLAMSWHQNSKHGLTVEKKRDTTIPSLLFSPFSPCNLEHVVTSCYRLEMEMSVRAMLIPFCCLDSNPENQLMKSKGCIIFIILSLFITVYTHASLSHRISLSLCLTASVLLCLLLFS